MKSEAEISAAATDGRPFSNGTEGYGWMAHWCDECTHNDEETELWCPILTVALLGKTPAEWTKRTVESEYGSYDVIDTCTEFEQRHDDDGPDEPEPDPVGPFDPEMPGQVDIFEVFVDKGLAKMADQREAVAP